MALNDGVTVILSVAAWLYIGSEAVASGLTGQSWLVTEEWMTRGLRKQSVGRSF